MPNISSRGGVARLLVPLSLVFVLGVTWTISVKPLPPHLAAHEPLGSSAEGPALQPQPSEHPLTVPLRWVKDHLRRIEEIQDYSATFIKQERVVDTLGPQERFFVKIRHRPFSIYLRGLAPRSIKGQEVIYVAGQNHGKMLVHPGGTAGKFLHKLSITPDGPLAMRDARYPITELGILNMIRQLAAVAEADMKHDDCEVKLLPRTEIKRRPCVSFEVVHPRQRPYFRFHLARVYVDEQLELPIRYEAYTWPSKPGGQPELLEDYCYLDLKLNNGFTDADFSPANPAYNFR